MKMTNELMEQVAEELSDADFDRFVLATWDNEEQKFLCELEQKDGSTEDEEYNLTELFENFGDDWLSEDLKVQLVQNG